MALEVDSAALVEKLSVMETREQRVMELLKTTKPERIEHDLRNVLNELSLLRVLFDRLEAQDPSPENAR